MRGRQASFWIVAGALLALLCAANLATTLYAVYSDRFGFSSAVLALIFATYTVVLIPAVFVCGQLSDRFGRRPVLLAGLLSGVLGLALFAAAHSIAWLFAARAVQAVSIAMVTGAAVAALAELEPDGDAWRSALVATLALTAGSGLGPLVGGAISQWAPDPLVVPYLVGIGLLVLFALAVPGVRETVATDGQAGWHIQRPGVPREIRGAFTRICVTAAAMWSVAMLFLSVLPAYTTDITQSTNRFLLGLIAVVVLLASCVSQLLGRRAVEQEGALAGGLALLVIGLVGLVIAWPLHTVWALVAGAVVAGVGHGVGFVASQHSLNGIAPEGRRGEITAAFYTCLYLGVSISVIGVGILADLASLYTGVVVFSAVTGAAALAVAAWQLVAARGRSSKRRAPLMALRGRG